MKEVYINIYYHDPDHPKGIVLIKACDESFTDYRVIQQLYQEFIQKGCSLVSSYYYDKNETDANFALHLYNEVNTLCSQHEVLAKDFGWDDFMQMKYMGWVVVQISTSKNELYNDGFWSMN